MLKIYAILFPFNQGAYVWLKNHGGVSDKFLEKSAGANPSDRGENGKNRHVLVDERGAPLSIVVTGANRHDVTQIEAILKNRIRKPRGRTKQNLCADAGYSDKKSVEIMRDYCYEPHIRPRGEGKLVWIQSASMDCGCCPFLVQSVEEIACKI